MNNFYSSLVINSKKFPSVHQVFRPIYNKEYFKRITANVDVLEKQIDSRYKHRPDNLSNDRLKLIKASAKKLVRLRENLDKLEPKKDEALFAETLAEVESIEDSIMPIVVSIPNRASHLVPKDEEIVEELKSDFQQKQNLIKVLSHRKLSYINNCYSKSIVGPNSHYYFGIGAKLQHGLSDYFATELENENFIPVSGLCLVKSALVEAVNAPESKDYKHDPCRILTHEQKPTTLHLTEASRESLVGFATTLGHIKSNDPVRLYTTGACYHQASDWFDGDEKRVSQSETAHAMVINSSIEAYSLKEYDKVTKIIWKIYKSLEMPVRLVHCSLDSMKTNEFDSHRIDIWLPSRQDWIQVGRISHYRDYLSIRVGMRRGHLIDSQLYDGQVLVAAIIENRQTAMGKFIIPEALRNHMIYLTDEERDNYFELKKSNESQTMSMMGKPKVLNNFEQRRYLTKRNDIFGHARKDHEYKTGTIIGIKRQFQLIVIGIFVVIIDWEEVWISYVPDTIRKFLYDYFYRTTRRVWWKIVYANAPENRPKDLAWAELHKPEYEMSRAERFRDARLKLRYGVEGSEVVKARTERARQKILDMDKPVEVKPDD